MQGISLLICCHNSEKIIEQTLQHVQNQEVENVLWEVILINNNSTDQTSLVAHSFWNYKRNSNFKIVEESLPGLSNARLRGIKEAKFDIVSFVDDDNLIPHNWVQYVSQVFQKNEIGVLGCTSIGKFDFEVPEWYEKHKLAFATGELYSGDFLDVTSHGLVYGAGLSMRKAIFEKLAEKNWKPHLTDRIGTKQSGGGDSELTLAARLLGYRIFYTNQIKSEHLIKADRLTWERLKAMTWGFGEADVFILPYQYQYKKILNKNTILDELRRNWIFNYLGKKVSLLNQHLQFLAGKVSKKDFEIILIRNKAFCSAIMHNRHSFSQLFNKVQQLVD